MKNKKSKNLQDILPDGHYPFPMGTDAYFSFLKECIEKDPAYHEDELTQVSGTFSEHSSRIEAEIHLFREASSAYPLMTVIFLWSQWISNDKVLGEKYLSMMQDLLVNNLLCHKNPDNSPVTIAEFSQRAPVETIDSIRCFEGWSISKREEYVQFYYEFSRWLSKHTFGFVPVAQDRDKAISTQRKLGYDLYVEFLENLELRERVMVKIFYLGGAIALEDVLSLEVKDIYFKECIIGLGDCPVMFSRHVLNDIKSLIAGRKKGPVFIGKHSERINHTVPYRALKSVAVKLGQGSDFTFKEFVKNR